MSLPLPLSVLIQVSSSSQEKVPESEHTIVSQSKIFEGIILPLNSFGTCRWMPKDHKTDAMCAQQPTRRAPDLHWQYQYFTGSSPSAHSLDLELPYTPTPPRGILQGYIFLKAYTKCYKISHVSTLAVGAFRIFGVKCEEIMQKSLKIGNNF